MRQSGDVRQPYPTFKTFKCFNGLQISATSTQVSSKFLLRSSSWILGHARLSSCCACAMVSESRSSETARIHRVSSSTIFKSSKTDNCFQIRSNPTSSTTFPEISMSWCSNRNSSCPLPGRVSGAYLWRRASKNDRGLSYGRVGRTKDPAVFEFDKPVRPMERQSRKAAVLLTLCHAIYI